MTWNTDLSKAPNGNSRIVPAGKASTRKVIDPVEIVAASACGVVVVTYWLPNDGRWNCFTAEAPPIAWQPYAGPRAYVDAKGKTRYAVDLPAHPMMPESWFATFMREVGTALPPMQRPRACLDWIAARSRMVAA